MCHQGYSIVRNAAKLKNAFLILEAPNSFKINPIIEKEQLFESSLIGLVCNIELRYRILLWCEDLDFEVQVYVVYKYIHKRHGGYQKITITILLFYIKNLPIAT